jgi:hypothetical protein
MITAQQETASLYNLHEDPLELFNLLESHPDRVSNLKQRHQQHLADIARDPLRPR